jgi:molybdopterin synthase catalytic subunit
MNIFITEKPFDPWQELQDHQKNSVIHASGAVGATCIFIGTMRDFNDGDDVKSMTLEYYPGMTEKQLGKIIDAAKRQWKILDTLIVHRVGEIFPQQPIVLVAVWASHRGDAYEANRQIMEALKSTATFWKKEKLSTAEERWVSKNTDGYQ